MKICWDNLENIQYSKEIGFYRNKKRQKYKYKTDICEKCGEEFLKRNDQNTKYCSRSCSQKDKPRNIIKNENHWNWKGGITHKKHNCMDCGKLINIKHKRCRKCLIKFQQKENSPNWKGGNYCIDCGKYLNKRSISRCRSCFDKFNKGMNNHMFGKVKEKHNCYDFNKKDNFCLCCGKNLGRKSKSHVCIDCYKVENTQNYIDGRSYDLNKIYCKIWTGSYKEKIRKRDEYTCQNPFCKYKKYDENLSVHHIDYNKFNCNEKNLISLCKSCHQQSNYNRDWHESFYEEIIRRKYGKKR